VIVKTPKHAKEMHEEPTKKRGWFFRKESAEEEPHHLHVCDVEDAFCGLE